MASVAEFEREVRAERQAAGTESARQANGGTCPWGGRRKGSRNAETAEKAKAVLRLKAKGESIRDIVRLVSLSRNTVRSILREAQTA